AVGTGVGMSALLSRNLGEKNPRDASSAARNGLFLAICNFIVFAILGTALAGFFFRIQTQDSQIQSYGIEYMSIISLCSFGVFLQIALERLLQSTGLSFYSMITQGVGAIINIVLDPILIFGLFGMP
ncbi:MAG: MATE family efflux transporter, partial [Niameybacter sp.]